MKLFQVSTLQALALGYTRSVVTVKELLEQGDIGLGTFEDVGGELIMVDGVCYRALQDGTVQEADQDMGIPFATVVREEQNPCKEITSITGIEELKTALTLKIEEDFGLNGIHIVRIDGTFSEVCARSESPYRSHHIDLKDILSETQNDFEFEDIAGTLVCIYFPDYMDGLNMPGWHIHFVSQDRTKGGHVFDLELIRGQMRFTRANRIEIRIPNDPAFDTYSLKEASNDDIKEVEQKENESIPEK